MRVDSREEDRPRWFLYGLMLRRDKVKLTNVFVLLTLVIGQQSSGARSSSHPGPTADSGTGRSDPYAEQGLEGFRMFVYPHVSFEPGMKVPTPDFMAASADCPWRYIAAEDRPRLQPRMKKKKKKKK